MFAACPAVVVFHITEAHPLARVVHVDINQRCGSQDAICLKCGFIHFLSLGAEQDIIVPPQDALLMLGHSPQVRSAYMLPAHKVWHNPRGKNMVNKYRH